MCLCVCVRVCVSSAPWKILSVRISWSKVEEQQYSDGCRLLSIVITRFLSLVSIVSRVIRNTLPCCPGCCQSTQSKSNHKHLNSSVCGGGENKRPPIDRKIVFFLYIFGFHYNYMWYRRPVGAHACVSASVSVVNLNLERLTREKQKNQLEHNTAPRFDSSWIKSQPRPRQRPKPRNQTMVTCAWSIGCYSIVIITSCVAKCVCQCVCVCLSLSRLCVCVYTHLNGWERRCCQVSLFLESPGQENK